MWLSVAAEVAVAHGIVARAFAKASRRGAEHDRLTTYEILGRLHTTLGDIKRTVRRCRVRPGMHIPTGKPAPPAGSSEALAASNVSRAAALESVKRLNAPRRPTCARSAARRPGREPT